jgi:hypothetical protein
MELPHVSLDPAAALPPASGQPQRHPVASLWADVLGDTRADGPGDALGDGQADTRGDGAPSGTVLVFRPAPAGDAGGGPAGGDLPAVVLGPRRPVSRRVWVMLAHWASGAWHSAWRTVTNPRGPYHARPESLAEHDTYRRSRAWVPSGHEGRFLGPLGGFYHHTFARFGIATGYLWAWLWARPLRLFIAAAVIGGIYLGFQLG